MAAFRLSTQKLLLNQKSRIFYHCTTLSPRNKLLDGSSPQHTDDVRKFWYCGLKPVRFLSESALYVNRSVESRTPAVNVALNLAEKLQNLDELKSNVAVRNIEKMDIEELVEDYKWLMKLKLNKKKLEEERKNIASMMAALSKVKETEDVKRSKELLKSRGKSLRQLLKTLNADFNILEETVIMRSLKLPNVLHRDTPSDEVKILQETVLEKDLADFAQVNHVVAGEQYNWIKFSNIGPGAYFLLGPLAWSERHFINHFSENLIQNGFQMMVCPEIFKAVVVEGCGVDITDTGKIYTLENNEETMKIEHICHFIGVSPMSFAAFWTRMTVDCEATPQTYFTIGKCYHPVVSSCANMGLYNTSQTTKCEVCSVCHDDTMADNQFQQFLTMIWNFYSDLNLPVRLLLLPASQLHVSESKKAIIEMWAPSQQQYLTVASVYLTGTYIGERLMISSSSTQDKVAHMVHADLLDVSRMLAFLIEHGKIGENELLQLPRLKLDAIPELIP
ncbi:serine--tRNA synthetase-like protein Slimp [Octopus bimaculoides]|uniref:Aminoacyl-tRNA synthetase class II (G/ P/ S/T) domain-containing protein n=1 Tax=Octopus bimaculoides TaxID=37653 RepID=A0A0L8H4S5_OCTBM|nr:serine--tRNA synthetase-like protein Slimp [Octopus bimaculoides]XP_052831741.1 serine--tRNA synthetase-like protein Slimp [Octopus bimaculoides]XP_052831742.1 serine--tRNA synthetase-like protein Slimp [Octopus bimaculoides]XP_052831743.1 serine--tRNA synthetase-like protein Slimp [Octopus bimaculoides]XP_052831744.1 serine--tRNA synthetase-like protein Slimp [Octopus bimaculoides]|eukprot:XP_014775376.1 PREDICTED: serine--tRNA ligase, mitochondrial-like [Octopus bimaculoides]